jgi:hypothetical protein
VPETAVALGMTGQEEHLHAAGELLQVIEHILMSHGVGVDEDVIEHQALRAIGREFEGDGGAQSQQELLARAAGEIIEGDEFVLALPHAADLERFVEPDATRIDSREAGENLGQTILERSQYRAHRGAFPLVDQLRDQPRSEPFPAQARSFRDDQGKHFLELGFAGVEAFTTAFLELDFDASQVVGSTLPGGFRFCRGAGGALAAFRQAIGLGWQLAAGVE